MLKLPLDPKKFLCVYRRQNGLTRLFLVLEGAVVLLVCYVNLPKPPRLVALSVAHAVPYLVVALLVVGLRAVVCVGYWGRRWCLAVSTGDAFGRRDGTLCPS